MIHKLLFWLPDRSALGRVMGQAILSLLVTVGVTSPSLAQEPVFSNDGMLWEGQAATATNEFDQDRDLLAMDAARNLGEHNTLILPEPDADEVARRMTPTDDADRQPRQTGFTREVAGFEQLAPSPAGTQRSSDGRDYAVSQRLVGSAGAVSIRLHFSGMHLPAGARLYVYGLADGAQPKGYDSAWLSDRTSFWSHTIPGDRAVVEYHAPLDSGTTGRPASYTVDQVAHNVADIFDHGGAVISRDAAACHLDMCDNPAWQVAGNGIMLLTFVRGSNTHGCSGALLNDQVDSGTPYIYTANHCISTQAEASTVELAYFYQRNSCADDPGSNTVTRLGSTLLATGGAEVDGADFTLLRASTPPPNGVTFLGWSTASINLGTQVTGIHHPQFDFKRISFGDKAFNYPMEHVVRWSNGAVEFGSSGSPAIINGPGSTSAKVIGTLARGTRPFCDTPRYALYGKFSEAWPSFHRYLDPDNSDVPDVIVDNVSVSDASVQTGVSFTINVTARNTGNGASTETTLRYYRSADDTITTTDSELTTDTVSALAPGTTSSESATVSIANPGVWRVGACIDTVSGEIDTNNCSTGVQVTVATPPVTTPTRPDMTVDNVRVTDATPAPGTAFTINANVRNRGGSTSAATTLRYYRSTNRTISRADTRLTTDTIGELAPGATSSESATVSIATAGNYWVGTCVDRVAGEIATANNCSAGVAVSVTAPPENSGRPDLTVDSVNVSDTSVQTGVAFTINATARNTGNGASTETTLRYYRSADDTITTTDSELTTDTVSALTAGGSSQESSVVSIANTGIWWVGACVDTVTGEVAAANNCSAGVAVSVTAPPVTPPTRPDLTVDSVNVSDASVQTGVAFTINATVRNTGNGASAATTLRYYRSADNTISTTDSELTTDTVSALAAGGSSQESSVVSIANTGNYWIGACVDTVADEVARTNNCSAGVAVSVTTPPVTVPPDTDGSAALLVIMQLLLLR